MFGARDLLSVYRRAVFPCSHYSTSLFRLPLPSSPDQRACLAAMVGNATVAMTRGDAMNPLTEVLREAGVS